MFSFAGGDGIFAVDLDTLHTAEPEMAKDPRQRFANGRAGLLSLRLRKMSENAVEARDLQWDSGDVVEESGEVLVVEDCGLLGVAVGTRNWIWH